MERRRRFHVEFFALMLGESPGAELVPIDVRSRKRRRSFFFSSSKALKKSRMNKKKVVSRTSQSTPGELRKSLRFAGGGSSGEDGPVPKNVGGSQSMLEESSVNRK